MDKKRVLIYGDSPTCATGFATVIRNIAEQLHATGEYDIDIIGINYYEGWYDSKKFPYRIVPAMQVGQQDYFGRQNLLNALIGFHPVLKPPYDIVFTLQDPFILEPIAKTIKEIQLAYENPEKNFINYNNQRIKLAGTNEHFRFKWIGYWPVDSKLKKNWVKDSIILPDYPVAYTEFGKKEIDLFNYDEESYEPLKEVKVINHGVNQKDFYPLSRPQKKQARKELFEDLMDNKTFLITNISRNQPRKDIARTMAIFSEFKKQRPEIDTRLYLHMKVQDVGGNLEQIADNFGLEKNKDYITPANFNENKGVSLETLNKLYNISDVCITSTLGEGWGFILTEAMQTKTTILAPDNTSIPEILGNGERGYIAKAGGLTEWFCMGSSDNERLRPLMHVNDAVDKLIEIYDNRNEAIQRKLRAYEWVQNLSWENIGKQWIDLFNIAYNAKYKE